MNINFIASGLMGDFIHCLYACKNICKQQGVKADLYLSPSHGGDPWRYGYERAYEDLKDIILEQPYINNFDVYDNLDGKPFINLNDWRKEAFKTRHSTGVYNKSWTKLLCDTYNLQFDGEYRWLQTEKVNEDTKGKILIHRSLNRQNSTFRVDDYFEEGKEVLFISSNQEEYESYQHKDRCKFYYVETISEMAVAINSCSLFVGNQSAPLALATALDAWRHCELEQDASPFYIGEEKYSNKISWWLDIEKHYFK